jgi:hypothetical protein
MTPPHDTDQQPVARVPLAGFKTRPGRLERLRLVFLAIMVVVFAGWAAGMFLWSFWDDRGQVRYSPGMLAYAHAPWEAKCQACHVDLTPISDDSWAARMFGTAHQTADDQCRRCHLGPPHHAKMEADTPGCASCHLEHRGREASLVRVADRHCTYCHADLTAHAIPNVSPSQFARSVIRFAEGAHPEFRLDVIDQGRTMRVDLPEARKKQKDPGKLTFNHRVHLLPGLVKDPKCQSAFKLEKIDPRLRSRYQRSGQSKEDLVQLDCASCHQLDSGDFGILPEEISGIPISSALPARTRGAYMLPITYENQCRACHPLTVERVEEGDAFSGLLTIRHRLQPDQIREFLEAHYTSQYLLGRNPASDRDLPGGREASEYITLGRARFPVQATALVGIVSQFPLQALPVAYLRPVDGSVAERVAGAERELYLSKKSCGECHSYQPRPEAISFRQPVQLRIEPPHVPDVWLPHAEFNHTAHRLLDCRVCHEAADASEKSGDILLPGIGTCLQCHGPPQRKNPELTGGARFDCVECHRYHHRDEKAFLFQGVGAKARRIEGKKILDIRQFLSDQR